MTGWSSKQPVIPPFFSINHSSLYLFFLFLSFAFHYCCLYDSNVGIDFRQSPPPIPRECSMHEPPPGPRAPLLMGFLDQSAHPLLLKSSFTSPASRPCRAPCHFPCKLRCAWYNPTPTGAPSFIERVPNNSG